MSQDAERIKNLIAFKNRLEKRVGETESELKELQAMLGAVNSILLEKGFKHAEIAPKPATTEALPEQKEFAQEPEPSSLQPQTKPESITPLKTASGELLANLHMTEESMRLVLAEDKNFDIKTPPFTHFLLERVLLKMQERDTELAKTGQLNPDKIFCYNIVREGDTIREIVIKNFGSDRLRELKSSIRWTLEKMYEKMKSQD